MPKRKKTTKTNKKIGTKTVKRITSSKKPKIKDTIASKTSSKKKVVKSSRKLPKESNKPRKSVQDLEERIIIHIDNEKKLNLVINENKLIISEFKKNIKSLEGNNANLKVKIIKLNDRFSNYKPNLIAKLENKIIFLEKEIGDLYTDLDTADDEIDEYLKEKDIFTEKNNELTRLTIDSEKLLHSRNDQFEKLSLDYDQLYTKYVKLEKLRGSRKRTSKKKGIKRSVQSLKELNEHLKTIEKLKTRLHVKDDEIDELINRLEIQEIKIEELEDMMHTNEKARVRLEKAYNRLKSGEIKTV